MASPLSFKHRDMHTRTQTHPHAHPNTPTPTHTHILPNQKHLPFLKRLVNKNIFSRSYYSFWILPWPQPKFMLSNTLRMEIKVGNSRKPFSRSSIIYNWKHIHTQLIWSLFDSFVLDIWFSEESFLENYNTNIECSDFSGLSFLQLINYPNFDIIS